MNGLTPLWSSLLPPVCDSLWFTADLPKNEEAELASLEDEIEQEKMAIKDQGGDFYAFERPPTEANEDEQEYDETEDDSYMGDVASDADLEPASPTW